MPEVPEDDFDEIDAPAEIVITDESAIEFHMVLYLQLRVLDAERAEETVVDGRAVHRPLDGTVRYFSVEAIMFDGATETLLFTKDEIEARQAVQRIAARHERPVQRWRGPGPVVPGF